MLNKTISIFRRGRLSLNSRRMFRVFCGALVACAAIPAMANAQDTTKVPTGVELVGRYNVSKRPLIAVRPFESGSAYAAVAGSATEIIRRDLDFSDRYEIGDVPAALAAGTIDYKQWNSLNVWY